MRNNFLVSKVSATVEGHKSATHLMELWRRYLEQYADHEGSVEEQVVVASYHAAEVLGRLTSILDREGKYARVIEQRTGYFRQGSQQAELFGDCLITGTFTIYNHFNTLAHQFLMGNAAGEQLIREVDRQVHVRVEAAGQVERSAVALNAAFPLLSLVTISLDPEGTATDAIREVERRFVGASAQTKCAHDRLINGLYRLVEMMQLFVALSDSALHGRAMEIAARFEEEDRTRDPLLKLRNGFCRLFELTHLVATHLEGVFKTG
ncbi:MAG: hypothetical protein HXY20_00580 [Acidobacteria bacterium]|nr:hypothetical protein [Acidobacteriota bacterium]